MNDLVALSVCHALRECSVAIRHDVLAQVRAAEAKPNPRQTVVWLADSILLMIDVREIRERLLKRVKPSG